MPLNELGIGKRIPYHMEKMNMEKVAMKYKKSRPRYKIFSPWDGNAGIRGCIRVCGL